MISNAPDYFGFVVRDTALALAAQMPVMGIVPPRASDDGMDAADFIEVTSEVKGNACVITTTVCHDQLGWLWPKQYWPEKKSHGSAGASPYRK